jgi:hypothetical protein
MGTSTVLLDMNDILGSPFFYVYLSGLLPVLGIAIILAIGETVYHSRNGSRVPPRKALIIGSIYFVICWPIMVPLVLGSLLWVAVRTKPAQERRSRMRAPVRTSG